MDLPGRPSGDADALRTAARAWDHLAWEIWQLSRTLEAEADALAIAWSGAAADAYADVWRPVRRGFYELDEKIHDVSGRLRGTADMIEGGQAAYDRALAAAGFVAAAGMGLTLLTAGLSDVAGAAAEGGIAATGTAIVADLELGMARVATLLAETTEALSGLASRFAVNFALRAPELAYGPVGGGAMGIGVALASGVRDPGDLAASGLLGAAESTGGKRAGGHADVAEAEGAAPRRSPAGEPLATSYPTRAAARGALSGALRTAANRFFRGATQASKDFIVTVLPQGGKRFQFFTPARNVGFGKLYVQEVDARGRVVREYKDTLGPAGLVERKWIHGEPQVHGG